MTVDDKELTELVSKLINENDKLQFKFLLRCVYKVIYALNKLPTKELREELLNSLIMSVDDAYDEEEEKKDES